MGRFSIYMRLKLRTICVGLVKEIYFNGLKIFEGDGIGKFLLTHNFNFVTSKNFKNNFYIFRSIIFEDIVVWLAIFLKEPK